jgi:DNA-nicking Smr family endonuclease
VIATVTPLPGNKKPLAVGTPAVHPATNPPTKKPSPTKIPSFQRKLESPSVKRPDSGDSGPRRKDGDNLDSHWDRRFKKGVIEPDVSIDLHGVGLSGAYARLDGALELAVHQGLRVILLVTGKQRSHDRTSGTGRGAIASVVGDWLAASRHASSIASVRGAHPRHGGAGALYIILKNRR